MNTLTKHPNQYMSTQFFIAMTLMAMSLPLSLFMMSIMQFILLGFWAYEGFFDNSHSGNKSQNLYSTPKFIRFPFYNATSKIKSLRSNKTALIIMSFYLVHLLGLFFTDDYVLAKDDIRTKLPIIVLTLIIASSQPLNRTQLNSLLIFFIAAVISGTFFGLYKYIERDFTDVREFSVFIHPIRFSLSICFSIFVMLYFIYKKTFEKAYTRILFPISIIWLVYFLILMESGMGLSILLIISSSLLIYHILKLRTKFRFLYLFLVLLIPTLIIFYASKIVNDFYAEPTLNPNELDLVSALGNSYIHDTLTYGIEDGKYIGLYICESELKNAWEERSKFSFDGLDKNEQELKRTLIRFLTSLDLRKDASGVGQLTDDQIHSVENGIANIRYLESPGIKTRLHRFLIGYKNYKENGNPSGNSLIQRLVYWESSIQIIKDNFWTGIGTGDIEPVFFKYYETISSNLSTENRGISHNQYLNFMVSYGIFGLIWFLIVLIYPFSLQAARKNYYYIIFMSILLISMLTADTIKNQAGITLYAFFNALFLFGIKPEDQL